MDQEPGSETDKPVTEPGAQVNSEQGSTKGRGLRGWDIAGIVLGVLALLVGLGALNGLRGVWWVGVIALFVSVCLFVPSRVYEHRIVHAIGLLAQILGTAVSVDFAVFSGYCAFGFLSDLHDEFAGLVAVIGVGSLIISAFAVSCTCVLVFKIKPRPAHAAIAVAAGIAVGTLVSYLLFFRN